MLETWLPVLSEACSRQLRNRGAGLSGRSRPSLLSRTQLGTGAPQRRAWALGLGQTQFHLAQVGLFSLCQDDLGTSPWAPFRAPEAGRRKGIENDSRAHPASPGNLSITVSADLRARGATTHPGMDWSLAGRSSAQGRGKVPFRNRPCFLLGPQLRRHRRQDRGVLARVS